MSDLERTLSKNKVTNFIIRIDFDMSSKLDYNDVSQALTVIFPNMQTHIFPHYNVNLNNDNVSVEKVEAKKFIFIIENGVHLELSPIDKAIIFSSNYYTTNDLYKERLEHIVNIISDKTGGILKARRIGMRYINTFPSIKEGNLPMVLNTSETKILKDSLLNKKDMSRLIVVDEYLKDDYRIRVQYGIPNKFYPNKISSRDIILDIDVYSEGLQNIDIWCDNVSKYNHAAYDTFLKYIRSEVIDQLK